MQLSLLLQPSNAQHDADCRLDVLPLNILPKCVAISTPLAISQAACNRSLPSFAVDSHDSSLHRFPLYASCELAVGGDT